MLQSEQAFYCPYCGETVTVLVDHSIGAQAYVEDCEVCCRPIEFRVVIADDAVHVDARRADD